MFHPPRFARSPAFPLLVVFAAMVLILQFRAIHDTDIFWQRKLGFLALQNGELITREPFTSTHADDWLPPLCWLSQIVHAALCSLGGWELMKWADHSLFAGSFLLVGCSLLPRFGSMRIALGMALGFMAALPHASLRPQTLAMFCFAAFLALLRMEWSRGKIAAIAVLLLVWQNLHPSVLVAVGVLGVRCLSAIARRDRPEFFRYVLLLVIGVAAIPATPCGFDLWSVSSYNARMSRELGVAEWLPPASAENWPASGSAFAALFIAAYLSIREFPKIPRDDVLVLLALTVLLLIAARFAVFWGVAVVPAIACGSGNARNLSGAAVRRKPSYHLPWVAVAVTIAISTIGSLVLRQNLFSDSLPFPGMQELQNQNVRGTIYNYAQWGGPLIDDGWPNWKVTFDGRYYLYSPEEWQRYREEAAGMTALPEIETRYRPEAFFLHPSGQAGLIELLRQSERWREVAADGRSVVFVRAKPK